MANLNTPDSLFERILITLYESSDTVATIDAVLRLLGEHYGVSRAYIFEDQEDGSWCKNTFEWCAEGITPQKANLSHIDYDDLGGKERFMQLYDCTGVFFCPDARALPPELHAVLEPQGIRAMLQCALMDNGQFCGYIGYDDCEDLHLWSSEGAEELSTISKLIGAFLMKARQRDLAALSEDYKAVLDNNAAYIYIIDRTSCEIVYSNRALRDRYDDSVGHICYEYFMNDTAPCENCPMAAYSAYGSSVAVEIKRASGLWLSCQASPIRMAGRELMMITCIDITEHKNADELLRQRSEEYSAVVKRSGKRIMRYDVRTGRAECYFDPIIITGFGRIIEGYAEKLSLSPRMDVKSRQACQEFFRSMAEGESEGMCDLRVSNPDGSHMWLRAEYTLILDSDNRPSHAIVTFVNNTAQFEKQLAYEKWHDDLTALSAKSSVFIEANLSTDIIEYQMGLDSFDIVDHPFSVFLSRSKSEVIFEDDLATFSEFFDRERLLELYARGVTSDSVEYRTIDSGEVVWYHTDVSLVKHPTNDNVKALLIFTNIDRNRRELEYFARLASMDPLTGLLNREAVHDTISDRLALTGSGELAALFVINLDNFKFANDRFGRQRGDEVLKSISRALTEIFGSHDVLGRVGGDEFIGFTTSLSDISAVESRAAAILDALFFSAGGVTITASVGVALCHGTEKTYDQLYVEADAALYDAKAKGRNLFSIRSETGSAPARLSPRPGRVLLRSSAQGSL